jgi:hypothetical protein
MLAEYLQELREALLPVSLASKHQRREDADSPRQHRDPSLRDAQRAGIPCQRVGIYQDTTAKEKDHQGNKKTNKNK